jgi:hypothetical protein
MSVTSIIVPGLLGCADDTNQGVRPPIHAVRIEHSTLAGSTGTVRHNMPSEALSSGAAAWAGLGP